MKEEIYSEPETPAREGQGLMDVRIRRYYASGICPYCERTQMKGIIDQDVRACTKCGLEISGLETRSGHQCLEEVIARHRTKMQERT